MSWLVFVDGASSGNPGPGGWGAILVSPDGQVTELGGHESGTTNNRMELQGAISALHFLTGKPGAVEVCTDSRYVILGITQWIWAWRKREWKTAEGEPVANAELWRELSAVLMKRGKENPVKWRYVPGHSGIAGNERVDEIAVSYSKGRRPTLYRGPLLKYDVPVHDLPEGELELKPMSPRKPKEPAYSYLSVVGGVPERHLSWPECERRVKGRSGAKFKKAKSVDDEAEILAGWGFAPEDVKGR